MKDGSCVIVQDFGPVTVRFDHTGIRVMSSNPDPIKALEPRLLSYYEQVRQFVKKTVEDARHEASKNDLSTFESELKRDIAEAELSSETEVDR